MRVNVYSEEMTDHVEIVERDVDGHHFTGLRLYLYLPVTLPGGDERGPFVHRADDDDSAAITFWGNPSQIRELLRKAAYVLNHHAATNPQPGEAERVG